MKKDANYLRKVKEQYENYPYPHVNPEDEKKRLACTVFDSLDSINHFHFGGKKNFYESGRFLVAGGGTGNSAIFLAEQLRESNAEIVYIDMSEASMSIAKRRAEIRSLNNIKWIQASILDIPQLNIGKFDYINCTGVLHHLENPNAGLDSLATALKDDGTINIMMYAKFGRTPLYQVQELMSLINIEQEDLQVKINNCRAVIENFPKTHLFNAVKNLYAGDLKSDAGLYDMFLHSQDRAYSVLDLYKFVSDSQLKISNFFKCRDTFGNMSYNPDCYIKDNDLLTHIKSLNPILQKAIAESLHGTMNKHDFSVCKQPTEMPNPENLDLIPSLSLRKVHDHHNFLKALERGDKEVYIEITPPGIEVVRLLKTKHSVDIFKYLDGKRTTKEIFDLIKSEGKKIQYKTLLNEFKNLFYSFNIQNSMFLRDKSVPLYTSASDMHQRTLNIYNEKMNV